MNAAAATRSAVERLLAAMGGREAWRGATGYRVASVIEASGQPRRESTVWVDFARERTRTEARAPGSLRVTLLDGGKVVRRFDGDTSPPPAGVVLGEREWWRANLYRTLHRLAANDPALTAYLTEKRLVMMDKGEPLLWLRLSPDGRPVATGSDFGGAGTALGPLRTFGAVRVPSTSSRDEGRWTATVSEFQLNPDLSAVSFTQP